jgi:hypothetical protein
LRDDGECTLPEIRHVTCVTIHRTKLVSISFDIPRGCETKGRETYCAVICSSCLIEASRHFLQFSLTLGSIAACSLSKTARIYGRKIIVLHAK